MFFVWPNQQQLSVPSCRPIKMRNGPSTGENVQSHVTSGMNMQSLHRGGARLFSLAVGVSILQLQDCLERDASPQ